MTTHAASMVVEANVRQCRYQATGEEKSSSPATVCSLPWHRSENDSTLCLDVLQQKTVRTIAACTEYRNMTHSYCEKYHAALT